MIRLPIALAALVLAASAAATEVVVDVARDGARWTADFTLDERVPALFFPRSAVTREGHKPWRPQSWRVATSGVRLERRGHYDVLLPAAGRRLPRHIRIAFAPFTRDLIADYDPALVFSDGSVALYTKQFTGFAADSAAEVARLPIDLNGQSLRLTRTRLRFADQAGPVLFAGERVARAMLRDGEDEGSYVLFGPIRPLAGPDFATIIDPELPPWLSASLAEFTPRLFAYYAEALGPRPGVKPTIYASWNGPTPRLVSMGGSVLPGIVTMAFEGSGLTRPNRDIRDGARWFLAHESAHFWLGQAVRYEFSRDSWITEGGADLLAINAVARLGGVAPLPQLQEAIDDCARLTTSRGAASAETRNEHRAYYACGAVVALAAQGATRQPFERFVRGLIAANRADGIVSRSDWLGQFERQSRQPALRRDIETLLDRGADRPGPLIASILRRAGIAFADGPDGVPRLT